MSILEETERRGREVSPNGIENARRSEGNRTMNMDELQEQIRTMRRTVRVLSRKVLSDSPAAAETIAHTYSYAGADDATANAKGGAALRHFQELAKELEIVEARLRLVGDEARRARFDAQEADQRRANQARKLKI